MTTKNQGTKHSLPPKVSQVVLSVEGNVRKAEQKS